MYSLKGASKHNTSGLASSALPILALRLWPLLSILTGFSKNLSSSRSFITLRIVASSTLFAFNSSSPGFIVTIPVR